jgi:hypothetical protein
MGCLYPALADLVLHLPDLLKQPHGGLDLQEAHQSLSLVMPAPAGTLGNFPVATSIR